MRIRNAFTNAFSDNKFLSFSSNSNFLSGLKNDKDNLRNYMDAISNKVDPQQAFNVHLSSGSSALKEYVRNTNQAKLSVEGFETAQRRYQVSLSAGDRSLGNIKTLMNEYNSSLDRASNGITKCGLSQQEFVTAVGQTNAGFGNYLSNLGGAKATMSGYVGALISAKVASIGLQVATMALNIAISMLATAAIGALIAGVVKLSDALDNSFSKAVKRASESKKAFEDTKSGVDDLNKQIEDIDAQISELESSSLTDPQDIKNLEKQKELLEAQRDIKQQIVDQEGKKAEQDAKSALTDKRMVDDLFNMHEGGQQFSYYGKEMDEIDELAEKQRMLDDVTKSYNDTLIKLSKTKPGSKGRDLLESDLKTYKDKMDKLQPEITEKTKDVAEQVDTLSKFPGNENLIKRAEQLYKDAENGAKELQTTSQIAESMDLDLSETLGGNVSDFTDKVDDYIIKTNELDDALDKFRSGDLSDSDLSQLTKDFPELAGQTDNLDEAISTLQKDMKTDAMKEFSSQMENVKTDGGVAAMQKLKESILGVGEAAVDTSSLMESLKTASEQYTNIQKALTESNSATGLTYENVTALDGMFSDLEGYDQSKLFEKTAMGITLNRDELKRLNELYAQNEMQNYTDDLVQLNQELALAQEQRDKYAEFKDSTDEADAAKRELYETYDDSVVSIQNQIAEVQNMATAWQGVTNAYNEYLMAQSSGNEKDSLEGVAKAKDEIKKSIDAGWTDTDDVNSYFDLVLGKDRPQDANEAWKQLHETIDGTTNSLATYLEKDDAGNLKSSAVTAWYNDISKVAGEGFAKIEEDGSKSLDLTGNKAEILAQKFGTTTEYVTLLAQALSETGVNVDFGNLTSGADQAANAAEKVAMSVEEAKTKLQTLQTEGTISDKINLDIDVNTASTDKIKSTLDQLKEVKIDPKVDPSGAAALEKLKSELQQEYLLRINAQTDGKLEEAESAIKRIQELAGDQGIDVALKGDNGGKIKELASQLDNMPKEVKTAVGIDVKNGDIKGILKGIEENKVTIPGKIEWDKKDPEIKDKTAKVIFKKETSDVDGYKPKDKEAEVKFKKDSSIPDGYKPKDKTATVKYKKDSSVPDGYQPKDKSATVTYHIKTEGSPPGKKAMGTMHFPTVAHKDGTMHNVLNWKSAYANGRVALNKDEVALVNELGTESLIILLSLYIVICIEKSI